MIVISAAYYPLILLCFREGACSRDDYRGLFAQLARLGRTALAKEEFHVTISVGGTAMSPVDRKFVAELTEAMPQELVDRTLAAYVVVESRALRGVMTALGWISPKMSAVRPISSVDEALSEAEVVLIRRGMRVEPSAPVGAREWFRRAGAPGGAVRTRSQELNQP